MTAADYHYGIDSNTALLRRLLDNGGRRCINRALDEQGIAEPISVILCTQEHAIDRARVCAALGLC